MLHRKAFVDSCPTNLVAFELRKKKEMFLGDVVLFTMI
jgi:hypothetical protein